jgi:glycine hydroxymethyltransferase
MEQDKELYDLIQQEEQRQYEGIELIASENFTSKGVRECLGSCLTNKYSEGYPGKRYYGGNQFIDQIENLCMKRALEAFHLDSDKWGCNVQAYSGSIANLAVLVGLCRPNDRIMGLKLSHGGHLTHGYNKGSFGGGSLNFTTFSGSNYKSEPYEVDKDGFIDYDALEKRVQNNGIKLIICGGSAYSRDIDYKRFRRIADICGAILMADISHINAFIATGLMNDPFEYCDIVTTTTHKSLRGPRSAIIFYRTFFDIHGNLINKAIFPGIQGGPHQNQIAAVAYQLREVMTDEFKQYAKQVLLNAKELCNELINLDYQIITGGTDSHLMLINLKNKGINGSRTEKILEAINISVNRNTIPQDTSSFSPSGIRIGTCAVTTRGLKEEHMKDVANFIDRAIQIGVTIQLNHCPSKLEEFYKFLDTDEINSLREEVKIYMKHFQ